DTFARSNAPGLTVEQVCRLRRTAADLTRSAATLERSLARRQATPAPFFGTVEADAVDIGALDAVWCKGAAGTAGAGVVQQAAAPEPVAAPGDLQPGINPERSEPEGEAVPDHAAPPARVAAAPAEPTPDQPDGAAFAVDAGGSGAAPPPSADKAVRARPARSAAPAVQPGPDAGAAPAWTTARLDQGPGWALDVVRPRRVGRRGTARHRGRLREAVQRGEPGCHRVRLRGAWRSRASAARPRQGAATGCARTVRAGAAAEAACAAGRADAGSRCGGAAGPVEAGGRPGADRQAADHAPGAG